MKVIVVCSVVGLVALSAGQVRIRTFTSPSFGLQPKVTKEVGEGLHWGALVQSVSANGVLKLPNRKIELVTHNGHKIATIRTAPDGSPGSLGRFRFEAEEGRLTPGNYGLFWRFKGDANHLPSITPYPQQFELRKAQMTLNFRNLSGSVKAGKPIHLEAQLYATSSGYTIKQRTVRIMRGGQTVATLKTKSDGFANGVIKFGKPGKYKLQAKFSGGRFLLAAESAEIEIHVR